MAIDYTPIYNKEMKWGELAETLTWDELRDDMIRLYDEVKSILEQCTDADIVFEPVDEDAHDPYAENPEEVHMGWTIGHLVAHVTASTEEGAAFGTLLARGIAQEGRVRVETPWEEIDTVEKAVQRLEESRRISLAYMSAIPDEPDFETLRVINSEKANAYFGPLNAKAAVLLGLSHHNEHIAQIKKTLKQAQAAHGIKA